MGGAESVEEMDEPFTVPKVDLRDRNVPEDVISKINNLGPRGLNIIGDPLKFELYLILMKYYDDSVEKIFDYIVSGKIVQETAKRSTYIPRYGWDNRLFTYLDVLIKYNAAGFDVRMLKTMLGLKCLEPGNPLYDPKANTLWCKDLDYLLYSLFTKNPELFASREIVRLLEKRNFTLTLNEMRYILE